MTPIGYSPEVEHILAEEQETINKTGTMMGCIKLFQLCGSKRKHILNKEFLCNSNTNEATLGLTLYGQYSEKANLPDNLAQPT